MYSRFKKCGAGCTSGASCHLRAPGAGSDAEAVTAPYVPCDASCFPGA